MAWLLIIPYSVADLAKSVLQVGAFKSIDKNYDWKNNLMNKIKYPSGLEKVRLWMFVYLFWLLTKLVYPLKLKDVLYTLLLKTYLLEMFIKLLVASFAREALGRKL